MWNIFENFKKKSYQDTIEITDEIYAKYRLYFSHEIFAERLLYKYGKNNGKSKVYIDKEEYEGIIEQYNRDENIKSQIDRSAELNNKGIALEKDGKIEDAINVYEENIKIGYPATHSYERLMILYHKGKRYQDEKRIVEIAISVFTTENAVRAKKAIKANPKLKTSITEGLEQNKRVMGSDGHFYCFCPYDLEKYKKRLEKVNALLDN